MDIIDYGMCYQEWDAATTEERENAIRHEIKLIEEEKQSQSRQSVTPKRKDESMPR